MQASARARERIYWWRCKDALRASRACCWLNAWISLVAVETLSTMMWKSELPPVTSAAVKNAGWHVNKPMPNGKEVTSACEYR